MPVTTTARIRNRDVAQAKKGLGPQAQFDIVNDNVYHIRAMLSRGYRGPACQVRTSPSQQPSFWLGGYCLSVLEFILWHFVFSGIMFRI
jgi:hypothetical protein